MFPAARHPDLLVGLIGRDDAAVYRVSDDVAVIATMDFFTPIVDDPHQYGAIAAANALSDVYAMGGRPILALNVSCLSTCLSPEVVGEILRGGAEKVAEAGAVIAGGHSVDDKEPKYGLAVVGLVHPDRILRKSGANPGDVLVLTKPLGVGIVTTAFKGDVAEPGHIEAAAESMLKLNQDAAKLLVDHGVQACTDVTGFALLGHACEMAERSAVQLRIQADRLPFVPGAREYAEMWLFPAGTGNNKQAFAERVHCAAGVPEETLHLLLTPETSGGLLAAVPAGAFDKLRQAFREANQPLWVVGEVMPRRPDAPDIEIVPN